MRRWTAGRFGLRERIWGTVVMAIAIVVLVLTGTFNIVVADRLDHEADSVAIARATAELDALHVTRATVRITETFDAGAVDTPTWVFQGRAALEQPQAPAADQAAAIAMTRSARGFQDVPSTNTRLYALPIVRDGRRAGTVISAVTLAQYERIKRVALVGSTLLALLALVAVTLAARWLISRALRPVTQMTRQAAEWSERDLERRFALGEPRDEFTRLAATLDGLLDRVASSLRHEQDLTAELSHELRTPLTQISAEAQYALRHASSAEEQQAAYGRILTGTRQMARILDTLIAAARAQAAPGDAPGDAASAARAAIDAAEASAGRHGVAIRLDAPDGRIRARVNSGVLERVLSPVLENACRYARRSVVVRVAQANSTVRFEVTDDGPGVPAGDAENIFVPSYRRANAVDETGSHGAGLGLPLARRLARGVGGDVQLARSDSGARFVVTVPHG
jgi:signal transduction histidine kinase